MFAAVGCDIGVRRHWHHSNDECVESLLAFVQGGRWVSERLVQGKIGVVLKAVYKLVLMLSELVNMIIGCVCLVCS